jgi:hypothetical protein
MFTSTIILVMKEALRFGLPEFAFFATTLQFSWLCLKMLDYFLLNLNKMSFSSEDKVA